VLIVEVIEHIARSVRVCPLPSRLQDFEINRNWSAPRQPAAEKHVARRSSGYHTQRKSIWVIVVAAAIVRRLALLKP